MRSGSGSQGPGRPDDRGECPVPGAVFEAIDALFQLIEVVGESVHSGSALGADRRVIGSRSVRRRLAFLVPAEVAWCRVHPALSDLVVGGKHPVGILVAAGVPRVEVDVGA